MALFLFFELISGKERLFSAGQSALPFLLVPPGARSSALGEAYAGVAEGPEALAYNPAGLAGEKRRQISLQHVFYIDGILYDNLYFVRPLEKGSCAFHAGFMNMKGLKRTVADSTAPDGYRELEDFSTNDFLAEAFYGRNLAENLGFGAGVKFVRESLADANAMSGAVDLGVLYQDARLPLRVGMSLQNLGPKIKYQNDSYNLPRILRAGLSLKRTKAVSPSWVPENSLFALDVSRGLEINGEQTASGGIEVPFFDNKFTGRAGYHYHLKKQSLGNQMLAPNGLAVGFGVQLPRWSADYSVTSAGDMGVTHHLTLSLRIGHD